MEKIDTEEEEKRSVKSSTRKGSPQSSVVEHPYALRGGNKYESLDFNECDSNVF